MNKFLNTIFFVSIFFPYINIFQLPTDTQPNAIVFLILLLLTYKKLKLDVKDYWLIGLSFVGIVISLINGINLNTMRSLYGYITIPIIIIISSNINYKKYFSKKLLYAIVWTWLLVAVVQYFGDKSFLTFLISNSRTTDDRGVTSLAAEPSYYGIVLIFIYLFNLMSYNCKKIKFLIAFQVIFLAQSFMTMFYFLGLVSLDLFFNLNIKRKIIAIFLAVGGCVFVFQIINSSENRIFHLIDTLLNDGPRLLFFYDASANERLAHIYISFKGCFDNYFLPNGFSAWEKYYIETANNSSFFWFTRKSTRIMSTYGGMLFEVGFFGFIYIVIINYNFFKLRKYIGHNYITILVFVNLFLCTAIPLAFPILPFLVGYCSSKNKLSVSKKEILSYEDISNNCNI